MPIPKSFIRALGVFFLVLMPGQNLFAKDLSLEALHGNFSLAGRHAIDGQFSLDGKSLALLMGSREQPATLDLWLFDTQSGNGRLLLRAADVAKAAGPLSAEEKNRRERQRNYTAGITSYDWHPDGRALLVPVNGQAYLHQMDTGQTSRITKGEGFATDIRYSPKGRYVSYVRDDTLFAYDTRTGKEKQLSPSGDGTLRYGISEFVAQEELGRSSGYWWSPDEQHVLFLAIDESPVQVAGRYEPDGEALRYTKQRYPFAGTANVTLKLGIVALANPARPRWIKTENPQTHYIADMFWKADSQHFYMLRLDRLQQNIALIDIDTKTLAQKTLVREREQGWVNLGSTFTPMPSGRFLWASERSGSRRLYLHDADGKRLNLVTQGSWLMRSLDCVNEKEGRIYASGWDSDNLQNHAYVFPITGGKPEKLSRDEGWHTRNYAPRCSMSVGRFTTPNQPPRTSLHDKQGRFAFWLHENRLDADHPYFPYLDSHQPWRFGSLKADDGTQLHYRLLLPAGASSTQEPLPAIIYVYGGPHSQTVAKYWFNPFSQWLADNGFAVFRLDNRGTYHRGKAFEDAVRGNLGDVEVRDQARGAAFLAKHARIDPERIGVYGWSYGGYMTLMMLAKSPSLYAAGVAGAPVTRWGLYDTAYTERYMQRPQDNAAGYQRSAVLSHADGLARSGRLLLIHGMADDNVLFANSAELADALREKKIPFDFLAYPSEKHGFRQRKNKLHRDRAILDFFTCQLGTGKSKTEMCE